MDAYADLARHLHDLPGGFPPAESGVHLRILRRMFTPEEAVLATRLTWLRRARRGGHRRTPEEAVLATRLTLLPEPLRVVARRAGRPAAELQPVLDDMARRGLVVAIEAGGERRYMALQFVIGIWELQVGRLTPELIADFEEYMGTLFEPEVWRKSPQLRTIPVGSSFDAGHRVMPYEQAEQILHKVNRIAVAPCICRREREMVGEGCGRLPEACLIFGVASQVYLDNGLARRITRDEALALLVEAERQRLVLQPGNSRKPGNICMCCGCCCGVLRTLKAYGRPGDLVSNAFRVRREDEQCDDCGVSVKRRQTDAFTRTEVERGPDGKRRFRVDHHPERCIGCGLCVDKCPEGALRMERVDDAHRPPASNVVATYELARARGKLGPARMARMLAESGRDHLLTLLKGS